MAKQLKAGKSDLPGLDFYIQFATNIPQHKKWFEYLMDPLFLENARIRSATSTRLRRLVIMARQVIQEEIYSYENYQGDGKIARSVTGTRTEDGFAIYFDPAVSGAKGPVSSGNLATFSYGAFFERPLEFSSFINPRDMLTPNRYRPFMAPMTLGYKTVSDEICMEGFRAALKIKKPRFIEE